MPQRELYWELDICGWYNVSSWLFSKQADFKHFAQNFKLSPVSYRGCANIVEVKFLHIF